MQFIMNPWSNKCICLLHLSTSMYATHGVSKDYSRPKFFLPKAGDRNSLAEKALEFLRQAPKNTTAYQTGANLGFHHVPDFRWVMTRLLFTCSTRIVCKTNRSCILWLCPHYGKQNQATQPKQQYNSAFFFAGDNKYMRLKFLCFVLFFFSNIQLENSLFNFTKTAYSVQNNTFLFCHTTAIEERVSERWVA